MAIFLTTILTACPFRAIALGVASAINAARGQASVRLSDGPLHTAQRLSWKSYRACSEYHREHYIPRGRHAGRPPNHSPINRFWQMAGSLEQDGAKHCGCEERE